MRQGLPMLRATREKQNLSLRALAERAGVTYVALLRMELGQTDPRLSTLRALAKALNVRVTDLIGEGKPARARAGRQ